MLRVGAWGPPEAGKTTTMVALGTELTHATMVDVPGSRAHIQWIDYVGGRHLNRSIHTQLIAITDDATTSSSDHVLKTSDALLFVADTTEPGIGASAALLDRVRATLREHGKEAASIVVQANKRDAADALPLDEVRTRLGLDPDAAVIETVATQATGVRHAFVVAVTKGLARYGVAERTAALEATPEELLDALTPAPPAKPKKQAAKKATGKKRTTKKADAATPAKSGTAKGSATKSGTAKKKAAAAKTGTKSAAKKQPKAPAAKKPLKTAPPLPDENLVAEGAVATLIEPPTVPATMVPPTEAIPAGGFGGNAGDDATAPARRSTDTAAKTDKADMAAKADTAAKADEAVKASNVAADVPATPTPEPAPTVPAAGVEAAPAPPPPGPDSVRFDAPPPTELAKPANGATTGRRGKGSGRRGRR